MITARSPLKYAGGCIAYALSGVMVDRQLWVESGPLQQIALAPSWSITVTSPRIAIKHEASPTRHYQFPQAATSA
jgi:hypothetical protein